MWKKKIFFPSSELYSAEQRLLQIMLSFSVDELHQKSRVISCSDWTWVTVLLRKSKPQKSPDRGLLQGGNTLWQLCLKISWSWSAARTRKRFLATSTRSTSKAGSGNSWAKLIPAFTRTVLSFSKGKLWSPEVLTLEETLSSIFFATIWTKEKGKDFQHKCKMPDTAPIFW